MSAEVLAGREEITRLARAALERSRGVLLVGAAGIGKSALAQHLGRELAATGVHIELVQCSAMTASVQFAPLMHLLPPAMTSDPTQLTRGLIDAVQTRAAGKPLVLVVDDLQYSDAGTAAVVFSLVTHQGAQVVASTRPGDTIAPAVQSLWKDGHLERIDVDPLDSRAVALLAEQVTGRRLSAALRTELVRQAAGNPFYALALTRVGLGSGAIQDRDGVCDLARPLPESAEVNDLLRSQLTALTTTEHELIEMIAIGENMPVELFGDVAAQQVIGGLTSSGLVVVDRTTPTHATRCAHPLIGEYIRSHLPAGRAARIHSALVDGIAALPDASPLDLLRAAAMALDFGIDVDPVLLMDAAQVAINVAELDLALKAALRASALEESARSHLLAGTALWMVGNVEQAHEHLDRAEALGVDETQAARLAIARSHIAVFLEQDPARSERTLRAAYDQLTDNELRLEIGAMMIFPLAMAGRNNEAIELGTELARLPTTDPRVEESVLGMLSMAKFMIGSFDEMDDIVERVERCRTNGGALNMIFSAQVSMADVARRKADTHLADAIAHVRSLEDLYIVDPSSAGSSAAWSSMLVTLQSLTGDLTDAIEHTTISVEEQTVADDPMGMAPMLHAARAAALAQAGFVPKAVNALTPVTDDYVSEHRRAALWKAWASAWILGHDDPRRGAELAAERGIWGTNHGMNFWSWDVLHTAVRLGHGALVVEPLEAEALRAPSALIALYAQHARAMADADVHALRVVASAFAACGAWACCAETYASAASLANDLHARAQDQVRGILTLRRCRDVQTPLVRALENPLSDHETDVAQLAAHGSTSKEIADSRFVSTRTIDNQLRAVYKKLGLSGRIELRSIF